MTCFPSIQGTMNCFGCLFVLIFISFLFKLTDASAQFDDSTCTLCHLTIFDGIKSGRAGFSKDEFSTVGNDLAKSDGKFKMLKLHLAPLERK